MRRNIIAAALVAMVATGAAVTGIGTAQAATVQQAKSSYVVSDHRGAPVRSGPGHEFPVAFRLPVGSKVSGTLQGKWLSVEGGWVNANKLVKADNASTPHKKRTFVVADSRGAAVRSGPGREFPVAFRLGAGETVSGQVMGQWLATDGGYVNMNRLARA